MIGLLTQMNLLSKHASEVFGGVEKSSIKKWKIDVLKEANTNLERIDKCKKRLVTIEEQIPATERRLLEKAPSFSMITHTLAKNGKEVILCEFCFVLFFLYVHTTYDQGLLFRRERASMEVNRRRANAEKPPDISSMDRFADDGKPCIKKFTDADFFMNEWLEAERLRGEEQKRKRKEKKKNELRGRGKFNKYKQILLFFVYLKKKRKKEQRVVTKKILKVQKKTYNTLGAEFTSKDAAKTEEYIEVKGFNNLDGAESTEGNNEYEPRTSAARTTPDGEAPATKTTTSSMTPTPGAPSTGAPTSFADTQASSKKQEDDEGDELDKMQTEIDDNAEEHQKNETVIFNEPHQAQSSYAISVTVPTDVPIQQSRPAIPVSSYDAIPQNMEEDDQREIMTPEMMIYRSRQQAEERMAREEEERKKSAEKQKANNLMPIKGTGLLAQIRDVQSRGNLKKVEQAERVVAQDQRTMLLDSIKSKQKLKHVESNPAPKEEPKKEEGGIFEVLKRRKFMEESEESSGSEWGSESD
ncbi:hypothetical protein RFI_23200 [Reticulomyxa filosa]|uniref:WH2 domain-containing protein n=1 Tax=Reticulomyxa filosa TaxID=46433 RepID=X6MJX4_RETFI|nr:hypothetical protein RFI_23200 [Reticulomyxa filosa]|eukprot:ETO14169.1 hypothetical protein RFI_23200 [Reticulomyxa filosa]